MTSWNRAHAAASVAAFRGPSASLSWRVPSWTYQPRPVRKKGLGNFRGIGADLPATAGPEGPFAAPEQLQLLRGLSLPRISATRAADERDSTQVLASSARATGLEPATTGSTVRSARTPNPLSVADLYRQALTPDTVGTGRDVSS